MIQEAIAASGGVGSGAYGGHGGGSRGANVSAGRRYKKDIVAGRGGAGGGGERVWGDGDRRVPPSQAGVVGQGGSATVTGARQGVVMVVLWVLVVVVVVVGTLLVGQIGLGVEFTASTHGRRRCLIT